MPNEMLAEENGEGLTYQASSTWKRAMELTRLVYAATSSFPADERFGLTNQLRRAAVSVVSNIAEGKGRCGSAELAKFLSIARGSAYEVHAQLDIAVMLTFGEPSELKKAQAAARDVVRMLSKAINTMRGSGLPLH